MNVSRPYTVDLGAGANRTIDALDASLSVPPLVMPVLLGLTPTNIGGSTSTVQQESFIVNNRPINTNQGAQQYLLATLSPGVYELEYSIAFNSDFTATLTAADTGVRLTLTYRGQTVDLMEAFIVIGNFYAYGRCRLLMKEQFDLRHNVQVTGVGQTIISHVWVNAIRVF